MIARIYDCVIWTFVLIKHLVEEGILDIDQAVFSAPVVVRNTSVDQERRLYSAELGTPLPADLSTPDPAMWRPLHDDLTATAEAGSAGQVKVVADYSL